MGAASYPDKETTVQTTENQAEKQLTLAQAASDLSLSITSLRKYVREGMPHERWGEKRLIRLRLSEVRAWLSSRGQQSQSVDAALTGGAR